MVTLVDHTGSSSFTQVECILRVPQKDKGQAVFSGTEPRIWLTNNWCVCCWGLVLYIITFLKRSCHYCVPSQHERALHVCELSQKVKDFHCHSRKEEQIKQLFMPDKEGGLHFQAYMCIFLYWVSTLLSKCVDCVYYIILTSAFWICFKCFIEYKHSGMLLYFSSTWVFW